MSTVRCSALDRRDEIDVTLVELSVDRHSRRRAVDVLRRIDGGRWRDGDEQRRDSDAGDACNSHRTATGAAGAAARPLVKQTRRGRRRRGVFAEAAPGER